MSGLSGRGPLVINPDVSIAAAAVIFSGSSVLLLWRLTVTEDSLEMTVATAVETSGFITREPTVQTITEVDSGRESFNIAQNFNCLVLTMQKKVYSRLVDH